MEAGPGEITILLQRWRLGDHEAESRLFELLIPDLRKIAGYYLRGERRGHSMQSTLLVNEAFLRLAKAKEIDWQDRKHFFAVAARMMRRFLIDHARSKQTVVVLPIEDLPEPISTRHTPIELEIAIDELLKELEHQSVQQCQAVELKHYLGLTDEEAAEALGLPLRTFQRTLRAGKRWLFERLIAEPCKPQTNATTG
jgi:RNA polymerase sigma factor (TIGR02999 family)